MNMNEIRAFLHQIGLPTCGVRIPIQRTIVVD